MFRNKALKYQISLIFALLISIIVVVTFTSCYFVIAASSNVERVTHINEQINRIEAAFDLSFENARNCSKLIAFSSEVQSTLRQSTIHTDSNISIAKIESSTISLLIGSSSFDSVYIFDFNGNSYAATNRSWNNAVRRDIIQASWYQKVMDARGQSVICLNSGGFLDKTDEDFFSVISLVNDINTLKPLGIIIVNISLSNMLDRFEAIHGYQILASDGSLLQDHTGSSLTLIQPQLPTSKLTRTSINGETFWCSAAYYPAADIYVVVTYNAPHLFVTYWRYFFLAALIGGLDILFVIAIKYYIQKNVERPVVSVLNAMGQIGNQHFDKIDVFQTNLDMIRLQNGYNKMVDVIHRLVKNVLSEQKLKRKYELNVLNAQVRPHFLYNTFDSVCALALMNRSKDVYTLMQALGKYYRTSLHKGDEVITLRDELTIIRNYAIIQNYRFENVFEIVYDIPNECSEMRVLKLIIQPFVENAIYHGLKTKGNRGRIVITARVVDGHLHLLVEDDGIGMSASMISKVMNGERVDEDKSFGVYGTIERIKLYYGEATPVSISSIEGKGTVVSIRIPIN